MLRSALQLRGYRIDAEDGRIGRVQDLYFDDGHWTVRYVVVETGTWLPGRRVLVSPVSLGPPDEGKHALPVRLTKAKIEDSPSIASERPVSRQLEKDIADYFSWPIYWTSPVHSISPSSAASPSRAATPRTVGTAGRPAARMSRNPISSKLKSVLTR